MPKSKVELKVINPRGEAESDVKIPVSPRLKSLNGKKIGIIRYRIPVGEIFFPRLEKALQNRAPGTDWRIWEIPFAGGPGGREARLKEIADNSDGVVVSMAISGGSTTRITPDA